MIIKTLIIELSCTILLTGVGKMVKIITKTNNQYIIDTIQHKSNGVIFNFLNDMVFLNHSEIKSIDLGYAKVSAKTYIKN